MNESFETKGRNQCIDVREETLSSDYSRRIIHQFGSDDERETVDDTGDLDDDYVGDSLDELVSEIDDIFIFFKRNSYVSGEMSDIRTSTPRMR